MSNGLIGYSAGIGLAVETTWGTAVTPLTHWLPIVSSNLTLTHDRQPIPHLFNRLSTSTNRLPRDHALMGVDAGGSIEFVPMYDDPATGLMFQYMIGSGYTDAGAGPYTHDLDIGSLSTTVIGLTMQVRMGGHRSETDLVRVFSGCVVTGWEITAAARSPVRVKCDIIGKTAGDPTTLTGTAAFAAADEILAHQMAATGIAWNSRTDLFAESLSVKCNKNLTRTPYVGSLNTGEPGESGLIEITVTARCYVLDTSVLADLTAEDSGNLVLTFTGAVANNRLVITGHNAILTKADLASDSPGRLMYDLEWRVFAGAVDSGLNIEFRNANATNI